MEQQEYFLRVNMLGQEAEKLEQQMQAIDSQINEMNSVKDSIKALVDNKNNKNNEILANLGKGIFIKTKLDEEKSDIKLFINIGKEVLVQKTPGETIEIIEEQLKRLLAGKEEFTCRIEELQNEMRKLIEEMQKEQAKEKNSGENETGKKHECKCKKEGKVKEKCGCGNKCECED